MVEFKQLRYFVAIAESSSFSKAAQKLFISQPALSQQISKLEEQMGIPLIERNTRSVQLTAAGRTLYLRATQLMQEMENMMQSVRAADANGFVNQRLRICLEDGMFSLQGTGAYEFIHRLQGFSSEFSIDCIPATAGSIPRLLSDGSADLGITFIAGPNSLSPNLTEHCFHKGRLALAVPESWDFDPDSEEFASAVNNASLYYPYDRSYWHGTINSFFAKSNFYPHIVALENYESALNFVVGGSGMFFAPEAQLRQRNLPHTRIIPIPDEMAEYRVSVLYATCNQSVTLQRILELLPKLAD